MRAVPRALLLSAALLCLPVCGAGAQTMVSFSALNSVARDCYVSALLVVRTGSHVTHDALTTCNAALESPLDAHDRAATLNNRGILHNAAQDFPAAWGDFDASVKLNPDLGDAWLNRGGALILMHQPEEAFTDIQRGISLGPSMPQIGYFNLGVVQQTLGHIPEAYAAYKQALAADPDFKPAIDALTHFRIVPANG